MNSADFLRKISIAVKEFYENDSVLTTLNTERPIVHRIALYLEPLFKESNIDCDYNRYGSRTKALEQIHERNPNRSTDMIYPDIVIHRRLSEERDNAAVIEVKSTADIDDCDRMKLELMTRVDEAAQYKYQFGLFLGFETSGCKWILFVNGERSAEGTIRATSSGS